MTLQTFGFLIGTSFSNQMWAFCVVVASTVEKGGPAGIFGNRVSSDEEGSVETDVYAHTVPGSVSD